MTIQCCVCNKVKCDGEWICHDHNVKDASHTYCPACLEKCLQSVQEELSARKECVISVA